MRSDRVAALQADWNGFGDEAFEFEVLDLPEPVDRPGRDAGEDLDTLEEIRLDELRPFESDGDDPRRRSTCE